MQKLAYLIILVSIAFLPSCKFAQMHEAQEFYTLAAGTCDTIDLYTSQWHTLRDSGLVKKNLSKLQPQRLKLGAYISKRRSAIANFPDNENLSALKAELDSFFTLRQAKITEVYPKFETINDLTPQTEIDQMLHQLGDDLIAEKTMYTTIKKHLNRFAKKHNVSSLVAK